MGKKKSGRGTEYALEMADKKVAGASWDGPSQSGCGAVKSGLVLFGGRKDKARQARQGKGGGRSRWANGSRYEHQTKASQWTQKMRKMSGGQRQAQVKMMEGPWTSGKGKRGVRDDRLVAPDVKVGSKRLGCSTHVELSLAIGAGGFDQSQ